MTTPATPRVRFCVVKAHRSHDALVAALRALVEAADDRPLTYGGPLWREMGKARALLRDLSGEEEGLPPPLRYDPEAATDPGIPLRFRGKQP